jgi:hypothetical protein
MQQAISYGRTNMRRQGNQQLMICAPLVIVPNKTNGYEARNVAVHSTERVAMDVTIPSNSHKQAFTVWIMSGLCPIQHLEATNKLSVELYLTTHHCRDIARSVCSTKPHIYLINSDRTAQGFCERSHANNGNVRILQWCQNGLKVWSSDVNNSLSYKSHNGGGNVTNDKNLILV